MKKETESRTFLMEFRNTLKTLPLSNKHKHLYFLKKESIKTAEDVEEILDILDPYWNYVDYAFLEHIIKEFGTSELQGEMKEYITKLEEFEKKTSVEDYNSAAVDKRQIPAHFKRVLLEQGKDPTQCSLYEVRQLKNELINQSSLTEYSLFLESVSSSSVVIVLAIPPEAQADLLAVINDEDFMLQNAIVSSDYSPSILLQQKSDILREEEAKQPRRVPWYYQGIQLMFIFAVIVALSITTIALMAGIQMGMELLNTNPPAIPLLGLLAALIISATKAIRRRSAVPLIVIVVASASIVVVEKYLSQEALGLTVLTVSAIAIGGVAAEAAAVLAGVAGVTTVAAGAVIAGGAAAAVAAANIGRSKGVGIGLTSGGLALGFGILQAVVRGGPKAVKAETVTMAAVLLTMMVTVILTEAPAVTYTAILLAVAAAMTIVVPAAVRTISLAVITAALVVSVVAVKVGPLPAAIAAAAVLSWTLHRRNIIRRS